MTNPRSTTRRRWRTRFLHRALRWLYPIVVRIQVHGRALIPRRGGCVLVFNHMSNFDAHLIFTLVDRTDAHGLVAAEYRSRPIERWLIEAAGGIWLRRGRKHADRAALRIALGVLARGGLVGIAPEGRRSATHALARGRPGAAFLAARAGVPVVPVAVTGTEQMAQAMRGLRRATVTVRVGQPFHLPEPVAGSRRERRAAQTRVIMESIAALLPERYHGEYANPAPELGTAASRGGAV